MAIAANSFIFHVAMQIDKCPGATAPLSEFKLYVPCLELERIRAQADDRVSGRMTRCPRTVSN